MESSMSASMVESVKIETSVPTKASQVSAKLEDDVLRLDIPL